MSRTATGIALPASFAMTLIILEAIFCFVPRSHGVGYTLAAQLWHRRYWKTNRLGYRDEEYSAARLRGKRRVLVIGDSFVAGHGINDPKDRFSNVLGTLLPPSCVVLNLGLNGADTRKEYSLLTEFPFSPDLVILAYHPNDIEGAARSVARFRFGGFEPYSGLPRPVRWAIERSRLLNFLYWLSPRSQDVRGYTTALRDAHADPKVRSLHTADLGKFVSYRDAKGVPLMAVFFPMLHDPEGSRAWFAPQIAFLRSRRVPVLDATPIAAALPHRARVVNRNDGHASPSLHALVGRELHRMLIETGLVP